MTQLQRQALNDCIDQRERALEEGRQEDARLWQGIILHTYDAYNPPYKPAAARDGRLTDGPWYQC